MPIYAYRCASCGHAQDVLQKMSDPVLTVCPACGAPSYAKQLTAAGFQLKGSGWYVTDFKGGNKPVAKPAEGGDGAVSSGDKAGDKPAEKPADGSSAKPADASAAKSADQPKAPAAAPPPAAAPTGTGS